MVHRAVPVVLIALVVSVCAVQAQVVLQLTDQAQPEISLAALDDAGTIAFAISNADPYGTNPGHACQIFSYDPATGDGEHVTAFSMGVACGQWGPDVSDDGQLLLFFSRDDLTGGNLDRSYELFAMQADGSGKEQFTDTPSDTDGSFGFAALAGDGSRAVFSSNADYLGTNTQRAMQIWVVDSDGSGLTQLTSAVSVAGYWATISDDGGRIVFRSGEDLAGTGDNLGQLFTILADGSGLTQLTSFTSGATGYPQISGDGSTITFVTTAPLPGLPGGCDGDQVAVINWDGSGLLGVASPCIGAVAGGEVRYPGITDDGEVIFYSALGFGLDSTISWEIFRINKDGSGWMQLTDNDDGPGPAAVCWIARAAGAGGHVSFLCNSGEPYGGPNPDLSEELYAMTGTGTDHLQLSDGRDGDAWDPDITPDGSRIVLGSDADLAGSGGYWFPQLYHVAPDGSALTQISSFSEGTPTQPSINDSGDLIVFTYDGDPLGTNGLYADQIFAIGADGSGLTQLTPYVDGSTLPSEEPHISGDGLMIVFQSYSDILGDNPAGDCRIYKVEPDGSNLARLSRLRPGWSSQHPRIDAAGAWSVYEHGGAIQRREVDGPADEMIASSGYRPDISADGGLVVYGSNADPLGSNPELNEELFLWNVQTAVTTQLTSTVSGSNRRPRFSEDGLYVYFYSDSPHFGESHAGWASQFRVAVSSGLVERVGGLGDYADAMGELPYPISVDRTGRYALFSSESNSSGLNADGSREIVAIDRLAPPRLHISPGPAPTLVAWDVESGPVRYDVIRGDVTSLGFDGSLNVDLGDVVCVENDSTDASTAGAEDLDTPAPGQVFFYLYRGSQGISDGPGSYGAGSGGGERLPASGGCS